MNSNSENKMLIDTDYMKIEEVNELIDYSKDARYTKLDNSTSQLSGLMQILPVAVTGNALSGAYRVEFPAGVSGALVAHKGGYLATIKDPETGRFVAQGTLFKLDKIGAAYSVFSALSIATNQYYMHQISQQLRDIQSKLNQVLDFLYNDKACEIYAEAQTVFGIYTNYSSIMSCPEQRIASLQTIQHAKIVAERNIQFYYRDMNHLVDSNGSVDNLQDDLFNYTQAINLYGICLIMEIFLSQNFDKGYLKYIEKDLKDHITKHNQSVAKLQGKLIKSSAQQPAFLGIKIAANRPDQKLEQLVGEVESILNEQSPIKGFEEAIAQICTSYTAKSEYRIMADGTVYQRKM